MLINKINLRLIFIIFIFLSHSVIGQRKSVLLTKIFFEYGFANCDVKIANKNKILFHETLNRDFTTKGATKIVFIKGRKYNSIKLTICGKIKKINIRKGMFYKINIIDDKITIEEVEMQPFYV
jgi:hypothetical protein